jgi:hypothetical protein
MPQKKTPKKSKSPDPDDFTTVARRLGCDEETERFEKRLGAIVRPQKSPKNGSNHEG